MGCSPWGRKESDTTEQLHSLTQVHAWASLVSQTVKNPPAMQETSARSPGREDPLEEGMATHSSLPTWRTPWTGEPGRPEFMGSHRVGRDWAAKHNTAHIRL